MEKQHRRLSIKGLISNLVAHHQDILPILPEMDQMNFRRLHLASGIAVLLTFSAVILFSYFTIAESEAELFWQKGIVTTHLTLLVIQAGIHITTALIGYKKRVPSRTLLHTILTLSILSILAAGIALVSLDQLVTNAITPFLIICVIITMLFSMRPKLSIPLLLATYLGYYFSIDMFQQNPAIVLSNRVNGLSAVAIGLFLALSIWRNTTRDFQQKQFIAKQQQELEQKNNELALLAAVDGLTGLLNRRELDKSLSAVLADSNLNKQPLSLILLDIDHFKAYNDLYGHVHGDECLRRIASLLLQSVQTHADLVARYGGEEFVIILPNTSSEAAQDLAENIRAAIVGLHIRNEGNPPLQLVSASFGVLTIHPPTDLDASQILNEVDTLMYAAKAQGRNRVVSA